MKQWLGWAAQPRTPAPSAALQRALQTRAQQFPLKKTKPLSIAEMFFQPSLI